MNIYQKLTSAAVVISSLTIAPHTVCAYTRTSTLVRQDMLMREFNLYPTAVYKLIPGQKTLCLENGTLTINLLEGYRRLDRIMKDISELDYRVFSQHRIESPSIAIDCFQALKASRDSLLHFPIDQDGLLHLPIGSKGLIILTAIMAAMAAVLVLFTALLVVALAVILFPSANPILL